MEKRTLPTFELEASAPLNFGQTAPNADALTIPKGVSQTLVFDYAVGTDGLGLTLPLKAQLPGLFLLGGKKEAGVRRPTGPKFHPLSVWHRHYEPPSSDKRRQTNEVGSPVANPIM